MKRTLAALLALTFMATASSTFAQDSTTPAKKSKGGVVGGTENAVKDVGKGGEAVVKDTGKGLKKVGTETGKGVKWAGSETKKGVEAIGNGTKKVFGDMGKGLKKLEPGHKSKAAPSTTTSQ